MGNANDGIATHDGRIADDFADRFCQRYLATMLRDGARLQRRAFVEIADEAAKAE